MTKKELLELKKVLKNIKNKKQKISFLDVISKTYDENIVSNWLSFIFDVDNNGIGNKPIDVLLNAVNYNKNVEFGEFKGIWREESTNDNKRMDLVIRYANIWIVIENKIYSSEHNKQTEKYFNYIEEERNKEKKEKKEYVKDVVYIYLRPDWNNPDKTDIPYKKYKGNKDNGFRNLYYSELINGFKNIKESEYIEKEKYIYLKNFIENGEKYYMGKEIEITDNIRTYIECMKEIQVIKNDYEDLRKNILNKLVGCLKEEFEEEYYINNSSDRAGYIQIANKKWNSGKNTRKGIHYEVFIEEASNFLGKKEVVVDFDIHLEGDVKKEKKIIIYNKYKENNKVKSVIKNPNKNIDLWFRLDNPKFDFSNDDSIIFSVKEIVKKMKDIDKDWCREIDSWKNIKCD